MAKKSIRNTDDLANYGLITNAEELKPVIEKFALAITPEIAALINKNNPEDPISQQFVPSVKELEISTFDRKDPIGDTIHTKVKGIIHRYPDRCLLMPVHICPVYCRFCFRREKVSKTQATLNPKELNTALNYIAEHEEIWEVILTGGDPLILKPNFLKKILAKLNAIKHVEIIRIHTRVPVVDPKRINLELIKVLKISKPIFIVLHANHPQEFSQAALTACELLIDNGFPMLGQTVLLKNINDNIEVLSSLMKCFVKNRIKPYYLHQADLAEGTTHFRTQIIKGQSLMKQLRGRFSGLCQPEYVLDIPGGFGKIPLSPNFIKKCEHQNGALVFLVEDYQGGLHYYKN